MWKKAETEYPPLEPHYTPPVANPVEQMKGGAVIGPSILVKGDVSGDEDLLIEGRLEGRVELKQHNVRVGKNGKVKADIVGKVISVEGEVQGNLYAEDKIIIRQSGSVRGNITAPRVTLEDGSKFKGSIDMDSKGSEKRVENNAAGKSSSKENAMNLGLDLKTDPGSIRP
ncbi:MAG: polymer-forming cytoskeletal protein [Acidobacteria bacterium]|nr:polymer-forming cytoskeletal protein [Acidobacteriota bacterium]